MYGCAKRVDKGGEPEKVNSGANLSDDSDPVVRNERGERFTNRGDYGAAMQDYSEAIRLNPKFAVAYCNRAWASVNLQMYDNAMIDLNKAIEIDPKLALAFERRGWVWFVNREKTKAIADFAQAVKINPADASPLLARANFWYADGVYDKSLDDLNAAIRIKPYWVEALDKRGWVWHASHEYEKAADDFSKAIRLKPNSSMSYNSLAWQLATCPEAKFRDGKRAIELATQACEMTKWTNSPCLDTLAAAYAETGDFVAAVHWSQEGIDLLPFPRAKSQQDENMEQFKQRKPLRD